MRYKLQLLTILFCAAFSLCAPAQEKTDTIYDPTIIYSDMP